ncbi:starch synthase, putative [Entamoeba dispar SAW760]|uniref:Starch synthase, putative n=1 Tax=Entamoeba dispar (strain ATCC PRA-260 / SAW760) TaxID=370354 RepID=B0E996_ENTDS|nr:starch synthase, putative [Entamoeba dispar SAW760]EDR28925.1 starch synthase, putative [Entamoeba dispar SAW760]|eukprot:EDR28925.1 starch synthase, putative [Entamoeba dispar SAW760]
MSISISLPILDKLLNDQFGTLQQITTLTPQEMAVHKALISGGDQCYKIIQYYSLKCVLIDKSEAVPKVSIVNEPEFKVTEGSILTIHQNHLNALIAGNGRNDLMFYKIALDQLSLILFPGSSKQFNEAEASFTKTLKNINTKLQQVDEIAKEMVEFKKQFVELVNKDFPETLFQKIVVFIKKLMSNEFFLDSHFHQIEELFISLLGYPIDQIRSTCLILLNCLYDGHLHQFTKPFFIEKILQVGDTLTLTNTFKHPLFEHTLKNSKEFIAEVTVPQLPSLNVDSPVKRTTFYMPLNMNIGNTIQPGEYDIVIGTLVNDQFVECQCSGGVIQSRTIVLPNKAKSLSIYGVSEMGYKPELLTSELMEQIGANTVHLININASKSRVLEDDAFAHQLIERVHEFDVPDINIMVDFPMEISSSVSESSPYRAFMCKTNNNEFAGNGDSVFMNYRSIACWEKAVEEIKTLETKCRIDAVRITSICDSLLPIAAMNTETAKGITGCEVDSQTIYGNDAITMGYPNPFLRKLTRDIWSTNPDFFLFVEAPVEELVSSIQSTVIPFIDDLNPLWSPNFKTMFQLICSNDEIKELENSKAPYYPDKYPQGTTFAYQFQSMQPSLIHFVSSLPLIPCLTPLNSYDKNHIELNKKRALIRERAEHLMIFGKIKVISMYNTDGTKSDRTIGIMREHSHSATAALVAINTINNSVTVHFDLHELKLKHEQPDDAVFEVIDVVTHKRELMSYSELKNEHIPIKLGPFDIACFQFSLYKPHTNVRVALEHQECSIRRCIQLLQSGESAVGNSIFEEIFTDLKENKAKELSKYLQTLQKSLKDGAAKNEQNKLADLVQELFYQINIIDGLRNRKIPIIGINTLQTVSRESTVAGEICRIALEKNKLGTIVFVTPELGRFSTIGGIGVLINELTKTMAELGCEVVVISPYYNMNKKGQQGYLKNEGIQQIGSVTVEVAHEPVSCGVHYGRENNVDLYFLHNYDNFPMAYPPFNAERHLRSAVLLGKSSLQLLCDKGIHPSLIITNDWFTGMVPAYAKYGFGDYFKECTFFHIVHNLEKGYIGDLYPDTDLSYIHELPGELVNNPGPTALNMSMCALKCSDNWGTVSKSYMQDALKGSPLSYHLRQFPHPFACSNGISVVHRTETLKKISPTLDHWDCKRRLQQKYFNNVDDSIPLFGFVGRICEQKGVFLLLDAIWSLVKETNGKCQFIIGGMAPMDDPYAVACSMKMKEMRQTFPQCFWCDPTAFFTDGPLMNMGCDFTCMPSMFEPSGLVQQESFLGGTPVIAFQTGGLKDTVFEYNPIDKTGNGFVFQGFAHGDLVFAIQRAIKIFQNPEEYKVLRNNAAKSVLDLTDVAIAWGTEFGRLKKKVFVFEL